jgi:CBS domain-containing protein
MKLKEIMTRDVEIVHPDDSLYIAACKMRDRNIGFLPVCDGDRLIGVLSDRDVSVRALAEGVEPNNLVSGDFVSSPVIYCYEDQDVEEAARLMEEHQIRRLVILNRANKRMVGVISLGDLALNGTRDLSGEVLQSVSEPMASK